MEVLSDVLLGLGLAVDLEKLVHIHNLLLGQSLELDAFWCLGIIGEWSLDRVVVMSTDGHELPVTSYVLVHFVLKVYERREPVLA